ncbi:MAG: GRRM system radical SAM/SPASM domain protein [Rhodospirillales bacterium]|nr:GRRM system radical SAM/SPASM domain protein [Rhodospirillales bacterium]
MATKSPSQASRRDAGTLSLLVVQSTSFCNIDCDYCYLPGRAVNNRMSEATLEALFSKVFASPYVSEKGFTLVWHAGEPLVLPVAYYRRAHELLCRGNRHNIPVQVSFQTNGTLLNDEWCGFFKEIGARIGVSIDGPRHLHDRHRRTRGGEGSFARTMAGVRCLLRNDVPFSVIAVLTAEAMQQPEAMYRFFIDNAITSIGFNVEEMEGVNTTTSLSLETCYAQFHAFYSRFLELNGDGRLRLREVSSLRNHLRTENPKTLADQCQPMQIITVDWQGGVSTFSPELHGLPTDPYGPFTFVNVHEHPLSEIFASPRFAAVQADILAGVDMCARTCPYFSVCGGGAPANKFFENGSFASTETIYCRTRVKALTDVLLPYFEAACGLAGEGDIQDRLTDRAMGTGPLR